MTASQQPLESLPMVLKLGAAVHYCLNIHVRFDVHVFCWVDRGSIQRHAKIISVWFDLSTLKEFFRALILFQILPAYKSFAY